MMHRPYYLSVDSTQLLSAAHNVVSGHGVSTDIVYYEEQFDLGPLPVPLTIWPPGLSILAAGFVALGMDPAFAGFMISLAAAALLPFAMLWAATILGLSRTSSILATVAAGAGVQTWWYAVCAATEPPFMLISMLAMCCLLRAEQGGARSPARWWLLAATLASGAFLIRYAGAALVIALGVWSAFPPSRGSYRDWATRVVNVCAIPFVTVAAVFVRNAAVTSTIRGAAEHHVPTSLVAAAGAFASGWADVFGLLGDGLPARALRWGGALGLLALVIAYVTRRLGGGAAPTGESFRRRTLKWVAVSFIALTALLALNAARQGYNPQTISRYLLPSVPFLVLAGSVAFEGLRRSVRPGIRWPAGSLFAMTLVIGVYVAGQARIGLQTWEWAAHANNNKQIFDALEESVGQETARSLLQRMVTVEHPMLATHGQLLGALVARPAIELPETRYSNVVWTPDEVHRLIDRFNVGLVVLHPSTFDESAAWNRNRVFFAELKRGEVPDWLQPLHQSAAIGVYAVKRELPEGAGSRR